MKTLFLVILFCAVSAQGWAQAQHPVDFDDAFFKRTPFSRWMRDPFKNPPGFAKSQLAASRWPKLNQVSLSEAGSYAILDGRRVREGEFIDENRYVSAIGQNFVIITEGNFDYELVLPDPKRSLAGESEESK